MSLTRYLAVSGCLSPDIDQNLVRIDIALPANYLDNDKVHAAKQLTRAGVRLAQLLDSHVAMPC